MPIAPPIVSKAQQRAIDAGMLVETINAFSHTRFAEKYCDLDTLDNATLLINDLVDQKLEISLLYAEHLREEQQDVLDACFSLIDASSADDYKRSGTKWSPSSKRREMVLPDMKYLLIQGRTPTLESGSTPMVHGFISFMITYEDGHEVIYIYEIHLAPAFRGQGIGKILLDMVEGIGRKIEVEKAMLTVFRSNERAVKWYDRNGYVVDDFSPGPRVLRNGNVKEPSYVILSKPLR